MKNRIFKHISYKSLLIVFLIVLAVAACCCWIYSLKDKENQTEKATMAEDEDDILIKFLNTSTDILASASDGSIDMQVNGILLSSNEVIMKYMIHDSDFIKSENKFLDVYPQIKINDAEINDGEMIQMEVVDEETYQLACKWYLKDADISDSVKIQYGLQSFREFDMDTGKEVWYTSQLSDVFYVDSDFINRSAKHVVLNQDVSVSDDIVMCFSDFYSSDIETRITMQTSALLTEKYYLYGKDDLGNTVIFRMGVVHSTGEGSAAGGENYRNQTSCSFYLETYENPIIRTHLDQNAKELTLQVYQYKDKTNLLDVDVERDIPVGSKISIVL